MDVAGDKRRTITESGWEQDKMRICHIAFAAALFLTGCHQQPSLEVAGNWCFFGSGNVISLEQDGSTIAGTGAIHTATSGNEALGVTGVVTRHVISLTFIASSNASPRGPFTFEYVPAVSPKGNIRFLKCSKFVGYSLIPAGIVPYDYDILKPEFSSLAEKRKDSQHGVGRSGQTRDELR